MHGVEIIELCLIRCVLRTAMNLFHILLTAILSVIVYCMFHVIECHCASSVPRSQDVCDRIFVQSFSSSQTAP